MEFCNVVETYQRPSSSEGSLGYEKVMHKMGAPFAHKRPPTQLFDNFESLTLFNRNPDEFLCRFIKVVKIWIHYNTTTKSCFVGKPVFHSKSQGLVSYPLIRNVYCRMNNVTYKFVTFGLHEWFIILTDGNMPQAIVIKISGKSRSVEEYIQCSMMLELHDSCAMCFVIRPPTYSIKIPWSFFGQLFCCKNQVKKSVYFLK